MMYHFKLYIRHLLRNKLYATVNIFSFAFALAFVFILVVYLKNETSVNNFHVNKNRIYRIEHENSTHFSAPIADELKDNYPQIEDYTRVYSQQEIISNNRGLKLNSNYLAVDPAFFTIFSYPFLYGNNSDALLDKNSIVLSKSMAIKLFGSSKNSIGKEVTFSKEIKFIVSGVIEDFSNNTHFKYFDAFINIQRMPQISGWKQFLTERGFCSMSIYFLEKKQTNLPALTPSILRRFKKGFWIYKDGYSKSLEFSLLKNIYFSKKTDENCNYSSINLLLILSFITLLILILAISNYVNLTITQNTLRVKEIAIKKALGNTHLKLFFQLIGESIFITLIAGVISILSIKLFEPTFNNILDTTLHINTYLTAYNILTLFISLVLLGSISGSIPSLRGIQFNMVKTFKNEYQFSSKSIYSNLLLIFQYTLSIFLIACSLLIIKQTQFLKNFDLGFTQKNILHINYVANKKKKETIRNQLKKIPEVAEVSYTWSNFLTGGSNQSFTHQGKSLSFQEIQADSTFFSLFDIKMSPTNTAIKNGVYLNKMAFQQLNLPQGETSFSIDDKRQTVLGIFNDFNINKLNRPRDPFMIHPLKNDRSPNKIYLRLNSASNLKTTLEKIRTTYSAFTNNNPFMIKFVNQTIQNQYQKEERLAKVISLFTSLSIFISFMGIFAMSIFYIQQRKKEIGIRKINGASISEIINQLNLHFLKWVIVAFIIATPLAWFFISKWLAQFAYRTTISWWVFGLSGIIVLIIVLFTVSFQSYRAAIANPIKSLKTE